MLSRLSIVADELTSALELQRVHEAKLAAETHAHAKLRERFQPELRTEQWTQTSTDMYGAVDSDRHSHMYKIMRR